MRIAKDKKTKGCENCKLEFVAWKCLERRFCSKKCYWENMKGRPNLHVSEKLKGRIPWNKDKTNVYSKDTLMKMSKSLKKRGIKPPSREGMSPWNKGSKGFLAGEKHYKWISDRTLLKEDRRHSYDTRYREWMKAVKNRDGWKCRISNGDCSGRLEAHHILGWKDYPELRYELNNGITLCHSHHPRKREDEKRLSPYFQSLVTIKAETL